jgi:hypothetical protein
MWYLQENNNVCTRTPDVKCQSSHNLPIGQMDFIVVQYSETNNGLMNNNQYHFQGNVV